MKRPPLGRVGEGLSCVLEVQYHGLAGTEFYVVVDDYGSACCHVGGFLGFADNLGITVDVEFGWLVSAVDDGHDGLAFILTRHHINAAVGAELSLGALRNHLVTLSPVEQTACPAEHVVLRLGASFSLSLCQSQKRDGVY